MEVLIVLLVLGLLVGFFYWQWSSRKQRLDELARTSFSLSG